MNLENTRVSVVGLGTMGHGIAQTIALAGCQVQAYDSDSGLTSALHDRVTKNLQTMVANGALSNVDEDSVLSRIQRCSSETEALSDSDFVIEAIAEDLAVKQAFFSRCEDIVSESTILASNTSSFPMSAMASELKHPERAINTHWFNPPHIIPVVEVVPGVKTDEETIDKATTFLKALGKHPVRIHQELPGFVLNRLQVALFREMLDLVGRGVISAEDLDIAVRGSLGLRWAAVGPMKVGDFGGWDILSKVYQVLASEIRSDTSLPEVLQDMQSSGNVGLKAGKGFFEFPSEGQHEVVADKDQKFMAWAKLLKDAYQDSSDRS